MEILLSQYIQPLPFSASQAEYEGSIPFTCSKRKASAKAGAFLLGATGSFQCSAEMNSACAKVLASGQNACTAHKRRPTVWGPCSPDIDTIALT
ncbi:hypothetical protein [uncultured Flavonifractor sp.]|uniref:hypothetical protein n=1 Tax=uncultured Flavonifractor sp. TaxID=1193534 RepID=UPI002614912E|nr:hypothetical protein [uncultured Flavonifractor sp.]